MPRRSVPSTAKNHLKVLKEDLQIFESLLELPDLRAKVLALLPVAQQFRDLGSSLISKSEAGSARERILYYLRKYPRTAIGGEELMVVAGISEWARRVRELRVQYGWRILSGATLRGMVAEGEIEIEGAESSPVKNETYFLADLTQDRDAAHRWHLANEIRRGGGGAREKLLKYFRANIGKELLGEELIYVANGKTEWARRVRELRTEQGWPIMTKTSGRPDLPVGVYVLAEDRQAPEHDRVIPDIVRGQVLRRDGYQCRHCSWTQELWNPSDPRHLELHHVPEHAKGGENSVENLITLCTVCHKGVHSGKIDLKLETP